MQTEGLIRAYRAGDRNFSGWDLAGSTMPPSSLSGICLRRAHLTHASWRQVNLGEADLQAADFSEADLTGAILRHTHAERALFHGARLEGADLLYAEMAGADLSIASLVGVQTTHAHLARVTLERTDLCQATLPMTDLRGADLREADLTGADLRYADLTGADLRWATLDGANLRGTRLAFALVGEVEGMPLAEQPTPLTPKGPLIESTVFADLLDYVPEMIETYWEQLGSGFDYFFSYGMIYEIAQFLTDAAAEDSERGIAEPSVRAEVACRLLRFVEWGMQSEDVSVRSLFQECIISLGGRCRQLYPLLESALGEASRVLLERQLSLADHADGHERAPTEE